MATKQTKKEKEAAKAAQESEAGGKLKAAREKFGEVASGIGGKVQTIREGAGKTAQQMREGAGKTATQVREGAGKAAQQLREGAGKASAAAREKYAVVSDKARHGYDRVSKDMDQLGRDVTEYVRHNPGKSIAIAAGVGFVLGLLMRRGRD